MSFKEKSKLELTKEFKDLMEQYESVKNSKLSLDMSRGKPSEKQVDLSLGMGKVLTEKSDYFCDNGFDVRNYGLLDGIPEIKKLFSEIMGIAEDNIIVGGNSSLNMMYDTVAKGMTHGFSGEKPWAAQGDVKFLCPTPGYDRHFSICESFGIEMINIPFNDEGPDMDIIEDLVSKDSSIKGIWCVPKYSNPDGITYSDNTVKRMAALKPAAKDFKVFWDNAYCIHDIFKENTLLNIHDEAVKLGNQDMILMFSSTSKITYPGAGVAAMAGSNSTIDYIKKLMFVQTIGHDKVNMLRHVRFLKDANGCKEFMKKHAELLGENFEIVFEALDNNLISEGIGHYIKPEGGYFVGYYAKKGCARRTVELCKKLGLVLTGAGATYPYGKDPDDSNIRIAPSYPSSAELRKAMEVFCLAAKIAAYEKAIID